MITVVLANLALLTHPSLIPTEGLEMPGGSASKAPPDLNTVTWLQSWCAALSNFFFSLCITEAASMSWTAGRSKKKNNPKYSKMSTNWGMGRKGPIKMTDIRFGFVIPLWFLLWFSEAAITKKVSQRTHPYLTVKYLFYFFQIILIYLVLNLLIRCLFF